MTKQQYRIITAGLALCLLSACGGKKTETDPGIGDPNPDPVEPAPFEFYSLNFGNNETLPDAYTCEAKPFGDGVAPELHWTDGPEGTQSYAIVFKDLTLVADQPQFAYHWMIWNIPNNVYVLPEALPNDQYPVAMGGAEQTNGTDFGYFGPCPSWQNQCSGAARVTDTYSFTLYAMPNAQETPGTAIQQAETYFEQNALDKLELIVTSDASPSTCPF